MNRHQAGSGALEKPPKIDASGAAGLAGEIWPVSATTLGILCLDALPLALHRPEKVPMTPPPTNGLGRAPRWSR